MSSIYEGRVLRLSIFGQSHSAAIGCVLDGLPSGIAVDPERIAAFMARRAPGRDEYSTKRSEADAVEILSGVAGGLTCGAPLSVVIRNTDTRSGDYAGLSVTPRPSHADFTARVKYGKAADFAGGGHFSGRLTAPLCAAGAILLGWLEDRGVSVGAHIARIAGIADAPFDAAAVGAAEMSAVAAKRFPVIDDAAGARMCEAIEAARLESDSVGGVIECAAAGLPAGLGDPMFGGVENRISQAIFAIPAVRGIEFGAGFAAADMRGSRHNDPFVISGGSVRTAKNDHGGVLGGITSGMPLVFRVAIKPTPSIGTEQQTVDLDAGESARLTVHGRHDPCIVPRAVPCIEAAAALVLADLMI